MMRKSMLTRLAVPGLVACALWLAGCGDKKANATLSGAQEVPPTTTDATGTVTAELDGDELKVAGSFTNLSSALFPVSGSAAHVHNAARGQNGPILFNLEITSTDDLNGVFSGSKTLNSDEKDAFENGNLYVNVHTVNFNGGEIRGQLEP
ncbi:CHRD domain-containing protein [Pyxidicoccus parkwayensis]|uniref:CHRD domain-containing protein n=1 Tax=Pyxidicoccus parkwayensis TaxID=2813578 RepID=A0ABX7P9T8_9BACT|nr:CHRD domain-containing protein [Pyxidicoccus parkwaysis]QSQ27228.1 CHRD domain-containing protein [Pyxidicoccus parkwaysis]